ncbi:hypothetical protein PYW08_008071 [Mythimna loreyi]|uniref:Uncharacterized protein n=1 Tax=Mythimna loreyi TaxID=667449 RepID=A0ACC2QBH8_9NEOP|nr:hypothetical protein PYW08_008071 [Mythimna loreyi]
MAELSFQTGQIIHVYRYMDDDGFYMAEIDGARGLVPSNFLADANDQYAAPHSNQGSGLTTISPTTSSFVDHITAHHQPP